MNLELTNEELILISLGLDQLRIYTYTHGIIISKHQQAEIQKIKQLLVKVEQYIAPERPQ